MLNYQNENWDEPRLTHQDFKAYFDATNQAMFVENREGYIVSMNGAACELWGASYNDLIGKHASEVLPPKLGTSSPGTIRRSRYTRPDQSSIDVEVLSTPITLGDEEAFLTTVWPATSHAEDKVENPPSAESDPPTSGGDPQADKMEALERLSKRVSHDFNNILTSIVGFSSLIQTDNSLSEANKGYLEQIAAAAARAERFSGELLAFGRAAPVPTTTFEPAPAIQRLDARIRKALNGQISLTTICEDGISPTVGSEEALAQIMVELADNTREAMPGDAEGEMKIELGRDDSGDTILRVSDNGPGMDEFSVAAAFEPFFTSHGDQKKRGFGLANVYSITRNLGWSVQLDSEHGSGTRFTFILPAAEIPQAEEAPSEPQREALPPLPFPASSPSSEGAGEEKSESSTEPESETMPESKAVKKRQKLPCGSETILVVEDEPMVREIVVRSLSHLGYTVHKACDGQEGLELSRELADEIDLIFSDIVMPRLSGPEMVQRIREEKRNTPVLFTTGFTESRHLLENGGDLREGIDLLQKPYTPNVLAERVREKLDTLSS